MLGAHDDVSASVSLTDDSGHLGHSRFGIGVDELGAIADNAVVLLDRARHETGNINKTYQGDIEGVTEADEPGGLDGGIIVDSTRQMRGLRGNHPDRFTVQPRE